MQGNTWVSFSLSTIFLVRFSRIAGVKTGKIAYWVAATSFYFGCDSLILIVGLGIDFYMPVPSMDILHSVWWVSWILWLVGCQVTLCQSCHFIFVL